MSEQQLVAPGASETGDPEHLACMNVERDPIEDGTGEPAGAQKLLASGNGAGLLPRQQRLPACHQLDEAPIVELAGRERADPPTVTQDRHAVGDREDFVEPMRHVDHSQSRRTHPPERLEQSLDLVAREHRRRLVDDEHSSFLSVMKRARDRDSGSLGGGQVADRRIDVDVVPELAHPNVRRTPFGLPVDAAETTRLEADTEREVLDRTHPMHEAEVLVDETQPRAARRGGAAEVELPAVDLDVPPRSGR